MKKSVKISASILFSFFVFLAFPTPSFAILSTMEVDMDSIDVDMNGNIHFTTVYPEGANVHPQPNIMVSTTPDTGGRIEGLGGTCFESNTICDVQMNFFYVNAENPIPGEYVYLISYKNFFSNFQYVSQPIPTVLLNIFPPKLSTLVTSSGFTNPEAILTKDEGILAVKNADTASFTVAFDPPATSTKNITSMNFTPYINAPEVPEGVTCSSTLHTDQGDFAGLHEPDCGMPPGFPMSGDNAHFGFVLQNGIHQVNAVTFTISSPSGTDFPLEVDYIEFNGAGLSDVVLTPPQFEGALSDFVLTLGDIYTEEVFFEDPDSTSWTATIDYGDGSGVQPIEAFEQGMYVNPEYLYTAPGTYTVTLTITDDQGLSTTETATIIVEDPQPVTVTFNASGDSYVRSGQDNHNYGAGQFMNIQSSGNNRSLVKFDQSELQNTIGSGTVLSATLQVTITDNSNNWGATGRTVDIHRMVASWDEGNGTENSRGTGNGNTWNCATDSNIANTSKNCSGSNEWEMGQPNNPQVHPWTQTATDTKTITNNQTGVVEYDVTADVTSFMNGTDNYGWLLKKTNEGQNGQVSFGTRESSSVPQLVVTYQP
jgi:hypothetical protein